MTSESKGIKRDINAPDLISKKSRIENGIEYTPVAALEEILDCLAKNNIEAMPILNEYILTNYPNDKKSNSYQFTKINVNVENFTFTIYPYKEFYIKEEKKYNILDEVDEYTFLTRDYSKYSKKRINIDTGYILKCSVKISELIDQTTAELKHPWSNMWIGYVNRYKIDKEEIIQRGSGSVIVGILKNLQKSRENNEFFKQNRNRRFILRNGLLIDLYVEGDNNHIESISVDCMHLSVESDYKRRPIKSSIDLSKLADLIYFNHVKFLISDIGEIWAEVDKDIKCSDRYYLFSLPEESDEED